MPGFVQAGSPCHMCYRLNQHFYYFYFIRFYLWSGDPLLIKLICDHEYY